MKGLAASHKRSKHGGPKLKVEFSRIGGAAGENTRTFVDEIVLFTRRTAPLIGVRTWREIHKDVKKKIKSHIMVSSDLLLVMYTSNKLFKWPSINVFCSIE